MCFSHMLIMFCAQFHFHLTHHKYSSISLSIYLHNLSSNKRRIINDFEYDDCSAWFHLIKRVTSRIGEQIKSNSEPHQTTLYVYPPLLISLSQILYYDYCYAFD